MTLPKALQDREYQKFDDTGLQPGQTAVRVTGQNFSGTFEASGLKTGGRFTEVTIDNTAWFALPATALTNRNAIRIQNRTTQEIKINFDPLETGYKGMVVDAGAEAYYDIKDTVVIYAKSISSSCILYVEEIA
jgi:hypothetical protein